MRISFDALRLCLLVVAGVTSGYLWRAAFESTSPAEERVAASPRLVEKAPAPPVVRIAPPHHLTAQKRPAVTRQNVVRRVVVVQARRVRATATSAPVPTPQSRPAPKPSAGPPPKPAPSPSPAPAPTPPATTTTTVPTPAPVAAPVQQPTPPPVTTPVANPPVTDDSRPGWGKGDTNHDHSGPGGKKP